MASPGPPYNDPVRPPIETCPITYRRIRSRPEEQLFVANLSGDAVAVSPFMHRGQQTFVPFDETQPYVLPGVEPDPEAVRRWLRQRIIETIASYEASGRFTRKELVILDCLWLKGWTLRRLAELEGVTPQAIRERIEGNKLGHGGLKGKAPIFYRWWAFKQRRRRGCSRKVTP